MKTPTITTVATVIFECKLNDCLMIKHVVFLRPLVYMEDLPKYNYLDPEFPSVVGKSAHRLNVYDLVDLWYAARYPSGFLCFQTHTTLPVLATDS